MKLAANFIFLVVISFTVGCQAGSSNAGFPKGCVEQGIEYKDKNLVLGTGSKQSLYLFHNISDKSYWLNHPVGKDPGASAGWASEIGAGNWSALSISNNSGNFAITCSEIGDATIDYLDCNDVVKSCKLENASFNSENSGSYWVAENKSQNSVLATITSRGISW